MRKYVYAILISAIMMTLYGCNFRTEELPKESRENQALAVTTSTNTVSPNKQESMGDENVILEIMESPEYKNADISGRYKMIEKALAGLCADGVIKEYNYNEKLSFFTVIKSDGSRESFDLKDMGGKTKGGVILN